MATLEGLFHGGMLARVAGPLISSPTSHLVGRKIADGDMFVTGDNGIPLCELRDDPAS